MNEFYKCLKKNIHNKAANIFLPGGGTINRILRFKRINQLISQHNIFLTDERLVDKNHHLHNFSQIQKLVECPINSLCSFKDSALSTNEETYINALLEKKYKLGIVTFGNDGHYSGHLKGSVFVKDYLGIYIGENFDFRYGLGHKAWLEFDNIYVLFDDDSKLTALNNENSLVTTFIKSFRVELIKITY